VQAAESTSIIVGAEGKETNANAAEGKEEEVPSRP
jgi:hypothetical protein